MKYSVTKRHAKSVVLELEQGQNDDQIRTALDAKGLYPKDIDEVMVLARQLKMDQAAEKVKEHLLNGTYTEGLEKELGVTRSDLWRMEVQAMDSFPLIATNEIKKMVFAGKSDEEIIAKVQNRFVHAEEIKEVAANCRVYNTPRRGKQRALYIVVGIAFITAGVGLPVFAYVEEIYDLQVLLVIPAIGVGFKALYEAFSSPRVSEQME
ncbi:MAG: hypothetical protein AB8F78_20130 [Saprospiraceae bacterium]